MEGIFQCHVNAILFTENMVKVYIFRKLIPCASQIYIVWLVIKKLKTQNMHYMYTIRYIFHLLGCSSVHKTDVVLKNTFISCEAVLCTFISFPENAGKCKE